MNLSSGQGAIPDRQYSLRAKDQTLIRCNSVTDGIVQMEEDMTRNALLVQQAGHFLNSNHISKEKNE